MEIEQLAQTDLCYIRFGINFSFLKSRFACTTYKISKNCIENYDWACIVFTIICTIFCDCKTFHFLVKWSCHHSNYTQNLEPSFLNCLYNINSRFCTKVSHAPINQLPTAHWGEIQSSVWNCQQILNHPVSVIKSMVCCRPGRYQDI